MKTVASNANYRRFPAFLDMAKKNLKALYDAGVPIGFGTDAGPPGRFAGFFEHWELQLMVEAGFTPRQAVAAATRQAAEFLKAADLGTLQAGKWADLVVLDADPCGHPQHAKDTDRVHCRQGSAVEQSDDWRIVAAFSGPASPSGLEKRPV